MVVVLTFVPTTIPFMFIKEDSLKRRDLIFMLKPRDLLHSIFLICTLWKILINKEELAELHIRDDQK